MPFSPRDFASGPFRRAHYGVLTLRQKAYPSVIAEREESFTEESSLDELLADWHVPIDWHMRLDETPRALCCGGAWRPCSLRATLDQVVHPIRGLVSLNGF